MSIKKILVTGSSGTIGTRLCEKLLDARYAVTGIDKVKNKWSDRVNTITLIGDLLDKEAFKSLPRDFDIVIHLAANARVYDLVLEPGLARDNIETVFNTMEFCRVNKINRFIFASSREVYGNSDKTKYTENDVYVGNCESPYSASKLGGEALVHAYHKCYGINYIITRFSNVYGRYDDSDRVIPKFIRSTGKNEDLVCYGKEKLLDFTYIDDTVSGVIKCIETFDSAKNDTYNIASGKGVSILHVAQLIQKCMSGKNQLTIEPNRTGEVVKYIADISKSQAKLGYEPKIGVDEGIRKTVEWCLRQKNSI